MNITIAGALILFGGIWLEKIGEKKGYRQGLGDGEKQGYLKAYIDSLNIILEKMKNILNSLETLPENYFTTLDEASERYIDLELDLEETNRTIEHHGKIFTKLTLPFSVLVMHDTLEDDISLNINLCQNAINEIFV